MELVQLQKHKGLADPLEVVAAEISDESLLLCLDEFMVCQPLSSFPILIIFIMVSKFSFSLLP